jgi:hypothetical protein
VNPAESATEFVPSSRSLRTLREAAADCRGCPLWKDATQVVFGTGPRKATLMLVGEQPGDREDIEGEPFVTRDRGRLVESPLAPVTALTIHPSAILRLRDRDEREEALGGLVEDLRHLAGEMTKRQR